jgi:hypothetical protein
MFDGVKKMFGGGLDISAMIGPMLPEILKDAAPKIVQAFDDKVLGLENEHELELVNEEDCIEEVAFFGTKRGGQLQIDWVVLRHEKVTDVEWIVELAETLETIKQDEFMKSAMAGLTNAPAPVKELPASPSKLRAISESVQQAPRDPRAFQNLQDIKDRHARYKHETFVVFANVDGVFEVEEGPMVGQTIWYGHQDEAIAQNWADVKNRELKGQ